MGQRLVISIYADKSTADPLATIYYHWSAYTVPAAEAMEKLIGKIQEWEDRNGKHIIDLPEKEAKLALVRIGESLYAVSDEDAGKMQSAIDNSDMSPDAKDLSSQLLANRRRGSGVSNEEAKRLETLYPGETFHLGARNYGLIDVTQQGMRESLDWAEADGSLYLDERTFWLGVAFAYGTEEWDESCADWGMPTADKLPKLDFDPTAEFSADEICDYVEKIEKLPCTYLNPMTGEVLQLIV